MTMYPIMMDRTKMRKDAKNGLSPSSSLGENKPRNMKRPAIITKRIQNPYASVKDWEELSGETLSRAPAETTDPVGSCCPLAAAAGGTGGAAYGLK